jgi:hypothetical protein
MTNLNYNQAIWLNKLRKQTIGITGMLSRTDDDDDDDDKRVQPCNKDGVLFWTNAT